MIYAGRAVQSFLLPTGETFEVQAEGAVLQLERTAQPGTAYETTVDADGQFRLQDLPAGNYTVSYTYNGVSGPLPAPFRVWTGAPLTTVLAIPSGPSPPPPGTTLLGFLLLSTGSPARIVVPEFALNERAQLEARFADNSTRTVIPDARGAWAIPQITGGFPVTLTASYQGLETVTVVPAPPAAVAPSQLHFFQLMPEALRVKLLQEGQEKVQISPGVPVQLEPEISNPGNMTETPRWIVEYQGRQYLSTETSPVFTFGSTAGRAGDEGGVVRAQLIPSRFSAGDAGLFTFNVAPAVPTPEQSCWSGIVSVWDPAFPNDFAPGHPASVVVTRPGTPQDITIGVTTVNPNGVAWFDVPLDPVARAPYLVRVDKVDHMPFRWPFPFQLPKESTFCVVPATVSTHAQTQGQDLVISHSSGMTLRLPNGSVRADVASDAAYAGEVTVSMVSWDPLTRSPLPPGAESRAAGFRVGLAAHAAGWFDIKTPTGAPLIVTAAATLTLQTNGDAYSPIIPGHRQVEATGFFEPWPSLQAHDIQKTAPGRYTIPLGAKGLFLLAFEAPLIEPILTGDRSLNFPFEVLVDQSIFPVTVTGKGGEHNLKHFFMPAGWGIAARVVDLLQAPGMHYPVPAEASLSRPLEPMRKKLITSVGNTLAVPPAVLPAIRGVPVQLSLAFPEPKLRKNPADTVVKDIDTPTTFLNRVRSTAADAKAYYAEIKAPATLAEWRTQNGFPAAFGAPLPGAGYGNYATIYYYNLGDLGFARAQTMRITTSLVDNQPDVAFAVTNYRTLEDARCRRSPIATVCMDYALLKDRNDVKPSRYTRFYVYAGDGKLLDCADLDGAGLKYVPNLCVTCHGGDRYRAGESANLGSRFLPFDMASYSFHPKTGVQKEEMAMMNAAVLKTAPNAAITDLIQGWYANPNPLNNRDVFAQNYVPSAAALNWSATPAQAAFYTDVFKHSCRVCHISRDAVGTQFGSYASLAGEGFGIPSVCSGLGMPHSQRTWGVFWGSRCSNKLGLPNIPDMPTRLGTAAGAPCR